MDTDIGLPDVDNELECLGDDKPGEECGLFGIYAPEMEVAQTICLALIALQHRGQESCGIVTYDEEQGVMHSHKGIGLVSQVFNSEEKLKPLTGNFGIGHTRYSTAGPLNINNAQPVNILTYHGEIAIAQNGNLSTYKHLRKKLMKQGIGMFKTSDIEVIGQMLASNPDGYDVTQGPQWEKRITSFMHEADGAYSLVVLAEGAVFACRDHLGMRPLCIGQIKFPATESHPEVTRYMVSSESCALVMSGATYLREVRPGEIIRIDQNGLHSTQGRAPKPALCIFEYVYFARPDSFLEDQLIIKVREKMGIRLAKEAPAPGADLVIGVPDSSVPAAMGYARQSGIPYAEGITKNRYVHRTFIQPTQALRKLGVSMKFTPMHSLLDGKKLVLVDDSIVRGSTTLNLVKMLRSAGAKEIHVRVSSPPVRSPCFMGIDLPDQKQMIAHNKTIEEICREIGADSLAYLSHEGLEAVVKEGASNGGGYCGACFTGNYPLPVDDW